MSGGRTAIASGTDLYLYSTGKAVAHEDLQGWLTLFFGLPDD